MRAELLGQGCPKSGRHRQLDPLQLAEKFEAQLVALVVGQPAAHLREYHLVVAIGPLVPQRLGGHRPRGCEDRLQLGEMR